MGLFTSLKVLSQTNGIGEDALLGRGIVIDAALTGMQITTGGQETRVCNIRVQVFLDGYDAYVAETKQRIPEWRLGQLVGGAFAVRVDRANAQNIALDFEIEPPVVTLARPADGGAATLLATGRAADAVIIANAPLGLRSWDGNDVHLFQLTIMEPGRAPYQTQVGNGLPAHALPIVYPGSRVKVKLGAQPNDIAIDWAATAA